MSSLVARVSVGSHRRVLRATSSSSNFTGQFAGARDVAILRPLVATAEQDDDSVATPDEIDPVAGTVVDPHFQHAASYRFHVARIAKREAANANGNSGARL